MTESSCTKQEALNFTIGINEIGLIAKLVTLPYEEVWDTIRDLGATSVELCVIPDHSDRIRAYTEEAARKYPVGMPPCLCKGDAVFDFAKTIQDHGLALCSCHLLLCEAYPELVEESVPYMLEIGKRTGISQFVISCMFDSASKVNSFLKPIQSAAAALKAEGMTLCYHNHHMDSMPLENEKTAMEMVLENCPDCMIQLDIGWAWYGYMDSVSFMKQYAERIASVHLKDLTKDARERTDDGRFTAIGSGAVPTEEALKHLHLCHPAPDHLIIDQDASTKDMYEEIRSGIRFVRRCLCKD